MANRVPKEDALIAVVLEDGRLVADQVVSHESNAIHNFLKSQSLNLLDSALIEDHEPIQPVLELRLLKLQFFSRVELLILFDSHLESPDYCWSY